MANSCKYYKQRREMSYDGVTWIPLDEYRKGDLVPGASSDCSSPTPTIYRWIQTENTVCVENQDTTYTKYYVYKKQQQVNGQWVDVYPLETKPDGNPLGTYSTLAECQGLFTGKFRATYAGGSTYELECDGNSTLTSGNTKPSGYQHTAMTSAEIGSCVTTIGNNAFRNCSGLTSVTIPDSVTSLGNGAFMQCFVLPSIDLPSGVTSIGYWAFMNCKSLTSIDIPDSVTSIDWEAFRFCTGLTSIDIPDSVTSIGYGAFMNCRSITSITISSGVTSIEYSVFNDCSSLTNITIPSGVTSIGNSAFNYCSSLTSVTCLATTPPTLGTSVFDNTNDCPIYVPAASLLQYQSSWSDYSSRIQAIP